jgi:hypothetical protein
LELFRPDPQHTRLLGAVQVQAARVIALPDTHADDAHVSHNLLVESECRSPLRGVQVFVYRQRGLREQCEAAGARAAFPSVRLRIVAKCTHRHDHENAARERADRRKAVAWEPRRAAHAHAPQRGRNAARAGHRREQRVTERDPGN